MTEDTAKRIAELYQQLADAHSVAAKEYCRKGDIYGVHANVDLMRKCYRMGRRYSKE